MSVVPVSARDLRQTADDLRELASECVAQARISSADPNAANSESASLAAKNWSAAALAAKNWSAAALAAVQAWMTAARGPGR